jgi:hypothetical protein
MIKIILLNGLCFKEKMYEHEHMVYFDSNGGLDFFEKFYYIKRLIEEELRK